MANISNSNASNFWYTPPITFGLQGWTCPKCGYVWAPQTTGCSNCNRPENEKVNSKGSAGIFVSPSTSGSTFKDCTFK